MMIESECLVGRSRQSVVTALLLATALQAVPQSPVTVFARRELEEETLGVIAREKHPHAAMKQAAGDVKALLNESGCSAPSDLLTASAAASCMLYAASEECPTSVRLALEALLSKVLESDDKALNGAVRSATAMTLKYRQLNGTLRKNH
jgi:hypothetical protein